MNQNDRSLVHLLRRRAAVQPDQYIYTFLRNGVEEESMTSRELDQRARSIAALLQDRALANGGILLLYPPGLEYITAFFGCLYAGIPAIPAYPPSFHRPTPRLLAIVEDAQPALVLTNDYILSKVPQILEHSPALASLQWLSLSASMMQNEAHWREPAITGDTVAFLQYTSGSTAMPKGVIVTHNNLLHNLRFIQQRFQLTPESRVVSWLPPYHDMGLIGGILQPLFTTRHFPAILLSPHEFLQSPFLWLQAISQYQATTSGGPNFAYDLCVRKISQEQRSSLDLSRWTLAFNGAEPIRAQTLERFCENFASCGFRRETFYACYGLAEATLLVSGGSPTAAPAIQTFHRKHLECDVVLPITADEPDAQTLVGSGQPSPEQRIAIVHPRTRELCTPHQVGEIWVAGSSIARGYWKQPEETEKTFQARLVHHDGIDYLRTGDLGFIYQQELFITGRLKDVIIVRGRNYYPQDIELTVESCYPGLRPGSGAAFAVESEGTEQLVVVQEVERHTKETDVDVITEAIQRAIADEYGLQVHTIVLVKTGTIPKTSSGKIQRQLCKRQFLEGTLSRTHLRTFADENHPLDLPQELVSLDIRTIDDSPRGRAVLSQYLQTLVAHVLQRPSVQIDLEQSVSSLGFDSLTTVEFKHRIETDLDIVLPTMDFFTNVSLAQLITDMLAALKAPSLQTPRREEPFFASRTPLSEGQKAFWFLHRLAPESTAYHISSAMQLQGKRVNTQAIRLAFSALINRHEALRSTFPLEDGEPVQFFHTQMDGDIHECDVSTWSEEQLNEALAQEAHRPFVLEQGPLLRLHLFRKSEQECLLLLVLHHIIADLWSLSVLMQEFAILYIAASNEMPPTLAPAKAQYRDYVYWQRQYLASAEGERLRAYWQRQLEGELPSLDLVPDHPRPVVQTFRGARRSFVIDEASHQRLKTFAQTEQITVYTFLLAAYAVLLFRYTAQTDILIGTPTVGRTQASFSDIVGYLVNPVVIRARPCGNMTFRDFLAQVRQMVQAALVHQDYPFPRVVEERQPERDASRSPLFQTMFILQQTPRFEQLVHLLPGSSAESFSLGDMQVTPWPLPHRTAQCDLTLEIVEGTHTLQGALEYNTDLFDEATIARMVEHWQNLLQELLRDPEQKLSQPTFLTKTEQEYLLVEWNATHTDYPQDVCLHQLFEAHVQRTPEAVALVFEDQTLTYGELNRRANQLAHHLQGLSVGPAVLVGICMEHSVEMVVGVLGVLKAGGVYVPFDPNAPKARQAFVIANAEIGVLITQHALISRLPSFAGTLLCLDTDASMLTGLPDEDLELTMAAGHAAYVIYTSGSTGQPKGVVVPHTSLLTAYQSWERAYQLGTAITTHLQMANFSFDVFTGNWMRALCSGGKLVLCPHDVLLDASQLSALLWQEQVDMAEFVPVVLRHLVSYLQETDQRIDFMKLVVVGGDVWYIEDFARLRRVCGTATRLVNSYGLTETTIDNTYYEYHEMSPADSSVRIGVPLANTEVYVLDSHMQLVPVGVVGEMYLGGACLSHGYLKQPMLTAERFVPHPFVGTRTGASPVPTAPVRAGERLYRTGDLARYRADGVIEFLGRIDSQVKLRGIRIELGEIETVLRAHATVQDCVIVIREDMPDAKQLVAYVVPALDTDDAYPLQSEMREQIEQTVTRILARHPQRVGECEVLFSRGTQINSRLQPSTTASSASLPTSRWLSYANNPILGKLTQTWLPDLRYYLAEQLPQYMIPTRFVVLESLPLLLNGKVDRKALPLPDNRQLDACTEMIAPQTPLQEQLALIIASVLQLPQVGIQHNFFELGGHSLQATQVVARIRQTLQVDLPLRSFFEARTIAQLSHHIEELLGGVASPNGGVLVPMARPVDLPLSFAQERLWFLDQWAPGGASYNMPMALRLSGPLQVSALEHSLATVVLRHEVLRTTFDTREGLPVQVIKPSLSFPVPVIDLSGMASAERDRQVSKLARVEAGHPFDLAQGPLLRVSLLRLVAEQTDDPLPTGQQEHVLLLTLHHIVCDGWSIGVLVHEITRLYQAERNGEVVNLPPLPIQYADYTIFQRQWLQGEVLEAQLTYWSKQLANVSPLQLPTDHPRPAVKTDRGALQSGLFPPTLSADLVHLCQQQEVTLFMLGLSAFQVLLMRYTGQTDISIGTPIANRRQAELEGLIGFFVNTLVLRTDLSGHPTFEEVLCRVRQVCLDAYSHQDTPFEKIVEEIAPLRDTSRSPLFQVMFVLQNAPGEMQARTGGTGLSRVRNLAGINIEPLTRESTSSKFDLTFSLTETEQGLHWDCEYSTDLFEANTIKRMLTHFQTLLEGVVQDPQARISDLPLLTATERRQILVEWNATTCSYPQEMTLHQLFEQQVRQTPDAIAVVFEENALTYQELNRRANQLAYRLCRLGIGPDQPVGVCMERSLELVVALLAVLKAGGAYVPLDPQYPQERLTWTLEESQIPLLLTQQRFMATWSDLPIQAILLDTSWTDSEQEPEENPESEARASNLLSVIYTSGSTGRPKGVLATHRATLNRLHWMWEGFPFEAEEICCQKTSLSFVDAVWELFGPLLQGIKVVLIADAVLKDPQWLISTLGREQITRIVLVPSLLRLLLDTQSNLADQLPHLTYWTSSGEALSVDLAVSFQEQLPQRVLLNLYGSSEVAADATCSNMRDWRDRLCVPIGHPIANTQIYLLDRQMQPVPIGVPGEVYIGGEGLARGYANRPELTAERFIPNPFVLNPSIGTGLAPVREGARLYRTGDLARYRPDGTIEYLGRIDSQVKLRGFRIELGEIEATLRAHPAVQEAVVVLHEEDTVGQYLAAYVVPAASPQEVQRSDLPQTQEELQSYLRRQLPEYMVPTIVVSLEALPLTPNGKVDRKAFPVPARTAQSSKSYVAPQSELEQHLSEIWQEVLGIGEPIGVSDNFFDLGGHSLLGARLIGRLHDTFQVDIPLRTLFEEPTIAQLALVLVQKKAELVDNALLLQDIEDIEHLTDDEVQKLLAADMN